MRLGRVCSVAATLVLVTGNFGRFDDARADNAGSSAPPTVAELMTRELAGVSNKEALMITVTYPPGGSSLPHRHDAQVFVYVLEGLLTMQVDGSAPVTLGPGQTFYEAPGDVHRVSANASRTEAAKILVFVIKDKGRPVSRTVGPQGAP